MWYEKAWRRHLCDMHIEDWNPEFLSEFDPEKYLENLKRAKIQSAMIPFQSHVGLCYYPTRSGKMHNTFRGKEDMIKRLTQLCHEAGISVTGYYSLIYNNYEHDRHPEWRMVEVNGKSKRENNSNMHSEFANNDIFRYGLCCPNNMEYRAFASEQIREVAEYFEFDGMFFDKLFWPHMCYCDSCKARWAKEVGGEIPVHEDWDDPAWLVHVKKRRQWMGEFAMWATKELKAAAPHASVQHNYASGINPGSMRCVDERVNEACDYVGGDLYGDLYLHSFTCKFYRNISRNQPFEYDFSRCEPNLSKHTTLKSLDTMRSSTFLTAAHHGATMVIDAIDPVGTMDERVYEQLGQVFEEEIPYEPYFKGKMMEDMGIYYTLKSKFRKHKEPYFNHEGAINIMKTLVQHNITCGVTGGYYEIDQYKVLLASLLSDEDAYDNQRIIDYVKNGGCLYFSGADNAGLLREFFGAECVGRTEEKVVYIAPRTKGATESTSNNAGMTKGIPIDDGMIMHNWNTQYAAAFERFNEKYPMHFDGTAPITSGFVEEEVIATITLPYTPQNTVRFASIHSNPPGKATYIPAMAVKEYGKGKVIWSALPIECSALPAAKRVLLNLLKMVFAAELTITSNAPRDVEVTAFKVEDSIQINAVLLNEEYEARKVEEFHIFVRCGKCPQEVRRLPDGASIPFEYQDGVVKFPVKNLRIFEMFEVR